ncbi:MAG: nuclear transport factor 2 family protein [Longimicrobiales bacterium]
MLPADARRAMALVVLVASGCARSPGPVQEMGPTGLDGALPGGDGRSALAYRAEFRGDVVQGLDSLMLAYHEGWRARDPGALAGLFGDHALLHAPGGVYLAESALEGWFEAVAPTVQSVNLWRDHLAASGDLAAAFGRYRSEPVGVGAGQEGHHLTVAKRRGRRWEIRSQFFRAPGADAPAVPAGPPASLDHITPDQIRQRRIRTIRAGAPLQAAEYVVGAYFVANSTLSAWRYHWNRDADADAAALLAPDAVVALPDGVPVVGAVAAAEALHGWLPGSGDLHMTIVDFDASELISFATGRFFVEREGGGVGGGYIAVIRAEDEGPRIQALLFSADAAETATQPTPTGSGSSP